MGGEAADEANARERSVRGGEKMRCVRAKKVGKAVGMHRGRSVWEGLKEKT